jgi:hypothetical membrane protein
MKAARPSWYAGAIAWALSLQYYVVQIAAAAMWPKDGGYSWGANTISDLANTHCGAYGMRVVCSPWHTAMNGSFIVLGITMVAGAWLLCKLATTSAGTAGFMAMALAGIGSLLVGVFPENTVSQLHVTGAALSFLFGNAGMILLGVALRKLPQPLRVYTIASGVLGLAALIFFLGKAYLGLGIGGMERIVAYPQSIWMIVFGMWLLLYRRHKTHLL